MVPIVGIMSRDDLQLVGENELTVKLEPKGPDPIPRGQF